MVELPNWVRRPEACARTVETEMHAILRVV